jgi:CheY-like chemotaxis protein
MMSQLPEVPDIYGKTFLVVEDEYLVAVDIIEILGRAGADVLGPVSSLEAALDLVNSAPPIDGAILDIHLRGAEVYPVADVLRNRGVPYAFMTAYNQGDLPARFLSVPYLQKPADPAAVLNLLQGLIRG